MIRFIGDVHGKFSRYRALAEAASASIQVGDFGIGFGIEPPIMGAQHRFIRGNHDEPKEARAHVCYLGDYGYDIDRRLFYMSGGESAVDRPYLLPGRDWWPEEQLSEPELDKALALYSAVKPAIVVTHMCPFSIQQRLWHFDPAYLCRTTAWLDKMWMVHEPDLWVFGHYHYNVDKKMNGTRFICLAELNTFDLEEP